jgi:adenosine deaminase
MMEGTALDWSQLPKIELHLHLDCSLSYEVVSQMDPSITYDRYRETFVAPPKCANLADCLTRAAAGVALMQTREQLRAVTADLLDQLQRDHVIYAEIRFAPLLHTQKGLSAEEVVETVNDALEKASQASGVEAGLILCTLRHYSEAQSLQTVKLVKQFRGTRVAGFDIAAADEAGYPIDAHIAAFGYAAGHNIPCTAHAGEAEGPESVWETLEQFRPSRIGHGVRSVEDPALLEHLREQKIHLEVCPTSNIQTNVYDTYQDHPISKLYRLGLPVSVNTDTRTMTDITLTQEYEKLQQTFGWDQEHFLACNLNALDAAFIPGETRQQLADRLRIAYALHE